MSNNFVEGGSITIESLGTNEKGTPILIGLVQSHGTSDSRQLPQVGELGSDRTFTLIGDSQKSGTLNRLMTKGLSVLKALYAPETIDEDDEYILGGDDVKVYASSVDNSNLYTDPHFIGLLQQYSVSSSLPVTQIGQLGGTKKYLLTGKANKSINFSRMMTEESNALKAFYNWTTSSDLAGVNWTDLDNKLFKTPIDIGLKIGEKIQITLRNATPGSIAGMAQQSSRGVGDSLSFVWNDTMYVSANNDISKSPIWLDLDNKECKVPFYLIITHKDDNGKLLSKQKHKECIVASVTHTISQGSKSTTESIQYMWRETEDMANGDKAKK